MAKCACGRSTSGDCMGWHDLTNEEYERVRMEEEIRLSEQRQQQVPQQPE